MRRTRSDIELIGYVCNISACVGARADNVQLNSLSVHRVVSRRGVRRAVVIVVNIAVGVLVRPNDIYGVSNDIEP